MQALLDALPEKHRLRAQLLYGSGLRLMECLRVQDVDFAMDQVIARNGKGAKDCITMLPEMVQVPLQKHLKRAKRVHKKIWLTVLGRFISPPLSKRNIPMLTASGIGNMYSPPLSFLLIREAVSGGATTPMKTLYKKP